MAAVSWLNKAWVETEAMFTHGWRLMGVVLGPREVDPRIASAEWCAWARLVREDADCRAYPAFAGRGESAPSALPGLACTAREGR